MLQTQIKNQISTNKTFIFINQILKGLGQIMLQESAITGLLFLVGIFYGSIAMGFGALLAAIFGTATAHIFKYNKAEIDQGLFGFSAALVGVAVLLFFEPVLLSWLMVVVGSVLATVIQHYFMRRNIPVFTLPFVLVTWGLILLVKYLMPELLVVAGASQDAVHDIGYAIKGFGQVIFQDKLLAGVIFFVAVYICTPSAALIGLAASVLSGLIALVFEVPIGQIELGLWSYNAVLCAIALSGNTLKDALWVLLATFISVLISLFMMNFGFIALTFPFVASTCLVLFFKKKA